MARRTRGPPLRPRSRLEALARLWVVAATAEVLVAPCHDLQQDGLQRPAFVGQVIRIANWPLLVSAASHQAPVRKPLQTFRQEVGRDALGAVLQRLKGLPPV